MRPKTLISMRHIHFSIQLNTLKVASNIHNHARAAEHGGNDERQQHGGAG